MRNSNWNGIRSGTTGALLSPSQNKRRITIFRGHPDTAGAFAESMTTTLAGGFHAAGAEVVIVSKGYAEDDRPEFIDQVKEIVPRIKFEYIDSHEWEGWPSEWIIWTGYQSADQDVLTEARSAGHRVTKSFPRLLGSDRDANLRVLAGRMRNIDFAALALNSDESRASDLESIPQSGHGYVPRGFLVDHLNPLGKSDLPVISIDTPVRPKDVPAEQWKPSVVMAPILEAVGRVRQSQSELQVIGTRSGSFAPDWINIKPCALLRYYTDFISPAWVYVAAPLMGSRHGEFLGDGFRGLYENQIVESQVAGALVVAGEFTVAPELASPDTQTLVKTDYSSANAIYRSIMDGIDLHRAGAGITCSHWTRERHNAKNAAAKWLDLLDSHDEVDGQNVSKWKVG